MFPIADLMDTGPARVTRVADMFRVEFVWAPEHVFNYRRTPDL